MKNPLMLLMPALLLSVVAQPRASDELTPADAELLTMRYDLRSLVPDSSGEQQWLQVLPFKLHHNWEDGDDVEWGEQDDNLSHQIQELIVEIVAPDEFSQANREIESRGEHTLVITAPQAVHESVRAVLDMIHAATHRRVMLEVEEFHLRRMPTALELSDPDRLRESGAVAFHQRREHEMLLGLTSVMRLESMHRVLRDWESEIAEGSFAADPRFDHWATGTVSMLRLEEDLLGDGFRLRYLQRASELVEWESRVTGSVGNVRVDQELVRRQGDGVIDQPRLAVGTTIGSRRLDVGGSVVVATTVDTADGPIGTVLRMRLLSVDPAPEPVPFALGQQYRDEDLSGQRGLLVMRDLSGLLWLSGDVPRLDARKFWPTTQEYDDEYIAPAGFPSNEWDTGRMDEVVEEAVYAGPGPSFRLVHSGWNLLAAVEASLEDAARRTALAAPRGNPLTVDVRVEARSETGNASHVIGRVALPLESSGEALALSGVAGVALIDYDVYVANSASAPVMVTCGYFDGLSVEARGIGDGAVDLVVTLHRLVSRERLDLEAGVAGTIDRLGFDRLEYRQRVAADGKEHRWGGASMGLTGSLGLELVISVRRE